MLWQGSEFLPVLGINNSPLCVFHNLLTHSSINGHLDCFHLSATVKKCYEHLLGTLLSILLGIYPEELLHGNSTFNFFKVLLKFHSVNIYWFYVFEEPSYRYPCRLRHFTFPPTAHHGSNYPHFANTCFLLFDNCNPHGCEVVSR